MGKNHPNVDKYVESRVRALESLLLEKGILPPDAVDRVIRRYEADTGPLVGARAVARAWRNRPIGSVSSSMRVPSPRKPFE